MSRSPMDLLDDALIDLESTIKLLDIAVCAMNHQSKDIGSMVTMHRHLERDVVEVRKAYDAALRARNRRRGNARSRPNLSLVGGSDDDAA